MCQHKAPHRNWAPPERHFSLYKDVDVPEPATLFDDYAGRSELLKQNEMSIKEHFYWGHDMKFHGENLFPEHFLSGIPNGEYDRMTDEQKAAWDASYEPENQAFIRRMKAGELTDRGCGAMEVPAVHQRLPAMHPGGRRRCRPDARLPR